MTAPSFFRPAAVPGLALGALLLAITGSAALPSPASAGSYTVSYCRDSTAQPVPLIDWTVDGAGRGGVYADSCTATSPMALRYSPDGGGRGINDQIAWVLTPTGGLTIGRHTVSGTYNLSDGAIGFSSAFGVRSCGEGVDTPCANGVFAASETVFSQAVVGLKCVREGYCAGAQDISITRNEVEFRDSTPPSGAVRGGALVGTGLGSPAAGIASVGVSASDTGAGVRRVQVLVDGNVVGATADQCTPPYGRMHPCSPTLEGAIDVDTRTIADGTRPMQVVAEDGSGERSTLWDGQVVIGNATTVGPGTDLNIRGVPNGSFAADVAKVSAWWPATGRTASKKKTVRARCKKSPSYRRSHKVLCNGRAPSRALTTDFSEKKNNIIRGILISNGGQPITGAIVRLVQTVRAAGAAPTVATTAVTDKDGRFKAQLPVASGSVSVAATWLARARDTAPAASVRLRRTVRSASTFAASPKRAVRRGRTLTFEGTLRGKAGTPKGTAITVQANGGDGWRAVKSVRAAPDGSWVVRYKVRPQLRGAYRFRALVTPSGAYPYSVTTTSSRRISVR